jgi:hypothetical protein
MARNENLNGQMNLPLCQTPPTNLPDEKQRELAAALADLLWSAAVADDPPGDEPAGDEA